MSANDQPDPAATDAVFEKGTPVVAPRDQPAQVTVPVPAPAQPDEQAPPVDPAVLLVPPTVEPAAPPIRDYVRELGQEFQEQQDEGKL
jgi:hypothetical protein